MQQSYNDNNLITQDADTTGMAHVAQPDPNLTVQSLIAHWRRDGQLVPTEFEIWKKTLSNKDPTTSNMITVFVNVWATVTFRIYHPYMNKTKNRDIDLYRTCLQDVTLGENAYTATFRMDTDFELAIFSMIDVNGRKVGPQVPLAGRKQVLNGTGSFNIVPLGKGYGPGAYSLVLDQGAPAVPDQTVVVRSSCPNVVFEIAAFKNGVLWDVFPLDNLGRKVEFSFPWQYAVKAYSYYEKNKSEELIDSLCVEPGTIVFVTTGSNGKGTLQQFSNRGLLAIPTSQELDIIEQAAQIDPNYNGY